MHWRAFSTILLILSTGSHFRYLLNLWSKCAVFTNFFNVLFVALVFSVPRTMKPAILSENTVAWILWYLFHSMLKIRSYLLQPQELFGSVRSAAKM